MKKLAIRDPFLFGEWFDLGWFHSCHIYGHTITIKERLGYGLSQEVVEQAGTIERIYFSRSEWTRIGKKYLSEVIAKPAKLKKLLSDLRRASNQLLVFSQKLFTADPATFSGQRLVRLFEAYHARHHAVWAIGQVPNVLEFQNAFLTDYLKHWLAGQSLAGAEPVKVFQTLVTPRELSAAQQEERAMLRLAAQKNPAVALRKHWRQFKWLQFGWTGPDLTPEYFIDVHQRLYNEGRVKSILSKTLLADRQLVRDKERLTKQLHCPPKIKTLFRLLEELLFLKSHRMDALYTSYSAIQPYLKHLARRHYLALPQLYNLYLPELIAMLRQGAIDADYLNNLAKYSVRYYDGKRWYLLFGQEARQITEAIKRRLPPTPLLSELKGECAYPGKVTGKVYIINRAGEMGKFESGAILVSNITDPSLLPAMKRAAAFVTNTGGLTCHAAIVAREVQIPGVIGTKIATQALRDGDLVEVDATAGVVRKIN
ncbi:MAG: hypothetical protein HYV42_02875 [Candidatus Magasanikbacteria bacterium]|nr:hypothetical protein [Candidatus Magasanikbacteria bacterium]